jgi:hypothetical protein
MSHALILYRGYFAATKNCTDRSLKLYIRRRIREDYRMNLQATKEVA